MPDRTLNGGSCERCGSRAPTLSFDKIAQKDLCPSCLNHLEGRRALLRSRPIREKPSKDLK